MADACVFLMQHKDFQDLYTTENEIRNTHVNIGTGTDLSIKELAEMVCNIIGYSGKLFFNAEKPNGTMQKLTDVSKLNALGWKHKMDLKTGVAELYQWYLKQFQTT
jgi:GDP-L-fucose synthase